MIIDRLSCLELRVFGHVFREIGPMRKGDCPSTTSQRVSNVALVGFFE